MIQGVLAEELQQRISMMAEQIDVTGGEGGEQDGD